MSGDLNKAQEWLKRAPKEEDGTSYGRYVRALLLSRQKLDGQAAALLADAIEEESAALRTSQTPEPFSNTQRRQAISAILLRSAAAEDVSPADGVRYLAAAKALIVGPGIRAFTLNTLNDLSKRRSPLFLPFLRRAMNDEKADEGVRADLGLAFAHWSEKKELEALRGLRDFGPILELAGKNYTEDEPVGYWYGRYHWENGDKPKAFQAWASILGKQEKPAAFLERCSRVIGTDLDDQLALLAVAIPADNSDRKKRHIELIRTRCSIVIDKTGIRFQTEDVARKSPRAIVDAESLKRLEAPTPDQTLAFGTSVAVLARGVLVPDSKIGMDMDSASAKLYKHALDLARLLQQDDAYACRGAQAIADLVITVLGTKDDPAYAEEAKAVRKKADEMKTRMGRADVSPVRV